MDGNVAFASVGDYVARYGRPVDEARLSVLLGDASDMLLAVYEGRFGAAYVEGAHSAFDRGAAAVCCAMVQRALHVPDGYAGATQMSQGGGGYTASVSFGGALGDLYVGKSELKRLGLDGTLMRSMHQEVRDA